MRVLVACEFSGTVRDAFIARGHQAVSCDLLPTEKPGPHIVGDVLDILDDGWDLMIAHPPCTYLTCSAEWAYSDGPYHQNVGPNTLVSAPRRAAREEALEFFRTLLNAPIDRIAIENPVGVASTRIRKPDQTVQPWQFGHGEVKRTCFWLKGLRKLVPTNIVSGREPRVHMMSPSADRWKLRSITFPGIASAMADQWGGCTCPILDGIPITGSACPLHGLSKGRL